MEHCLVFASLISPSKMILFEKKYQTFDTVFHHQMKHLEVRQKYSAARRIFNSLLGVSPGGETLHLMFDILLNLLYLSLTSDKQKAEESLGEINGDLFEVTAELKTATEELEASKITKESLREELNELQETITGEKVNT